MSDSTYTSNIIGSEISWTEGRNAQERTIKEKVYFSNKYTYDDNTKEVKTIEIVVYDNAKGENPVVVGEMVNGKFKPNNNAKDVQFSTRGKNNDRSWNKLTNEMKNDLNKSSKEISNSNEVKDALGVNKDTERLDKYNEAIGDKNKSTEDVTGEVDAKTKEEADKVKKFLRNKDNRKFRKEYGNYFYPITIESNTQDRVKISVIDFKPIDITDNETVFDLSDSRDTEEIIRGSATLPIPDGVSDQNAVDFGNGTLNPLQVAGATSALNGLLGGVGAAGQNLGAIARQTLGNEQTVGAVSSILTSLALNINPNELVSRTSGAIFNNNLSLLFKGPTLRPFAFNFVISPRGEKESIQVMKIIRMFKQASAVQRTTNGLFLGSPHIFKIEFLAGKTGTHKFLPRIKDCALLSFRVNYMPTNSYMTYENSSMVAYGLQFNFKEIDPIFNDDYDELDITDFDEPIISDDEGSITFFKQETDSGGIGF